MSVRCETRSDLEAYGIAILILSVILFFFAFGAVMAIRDGEAPDGEDFVMVGLLGTAYVLLTAWVALRIREWRTLGDAMLNLSPARPRVGEPLTCRMQFERPPAEQGPVRAELLCQVTTQTGSGKSKKSKTETLWKDSQITPTTSLMQFTFQPPGELPAAEKAMGRDVRWWLRVRTGGLNGFRRRFRMPVLGKAGTEQGGTFELMKAEIAAAGPGELPRAFRVIYTLCALALFVNASLLAWGFSDRLQVGQPPAAEFDGKLRLGDLRQTSAYDFAAQLDGAFAWRRGSLEVQAESLRLRAWACDAACPRIQELSLVLWHFTEDDKGGTSGVSLARSEPLSIDKIPQEDAVLDLGARSFLLRVPKNPDPRTAALVLEVKTEKREYEYGQRFGGASHLLGLVQLPGDPSRCASVRDARSALEHFCHAEFAERLSESPAAERERFLFLAAGRGNLEAVKALLAAKTRVDPVNSYGYTPLMVAVFADQPAIAAALLDGGANPNFIAKPDAKYGGDTPLGAALAAGALRSVEVLLGKGADPKVPHSRSPVVHVAVAADLPEAIALLVKNGAEIDARAGWGHQPTPLMAASGIGNLRAVNQLLELGADPAAGDKYRNTARDYAATHKRPEVVERLKGFPGRCPLTGCK